MRRMIASLLLWGTTFCSGQSIVVVTNFRQVTTSAVNPSCSGITGTYTTCFDTLQNPLSSPWTTGLTGKYTSVAATTLGALSPSGGIGFAVLTGVSLPDNQSARFLIDGDSGFDVGISAVCIRMDTSGNGYCYLIGQATAYVLTTGNGGATPVTGCPPRVGGHIYELSAVGVTLTCKDLTAGSSTTGMDSTYRNGSAGFLVDDSHDGTMAVKKFGAN